MANGKAGAPKGNTNSSKKNRMVGDALRAAAKQNPDKLKKACEALMDKAVEGDIQAFNAFRDTLDGKPAQTVDLSVTDMTHEDALDMLEDDSAG